MSVRISERDLLAFEAYRTKRGDPLSLSTHLQLLEYVRRRPLLSVRPWLHLGMGFSAIILGGLMLPNVYGWMLFLTGGVLNFAVAQKLTR